MSGKVKIRENGRVNISEDKRKIGLDISNNELLQISTADNRTKLNTSSNSKKRRATVVDETKLIYNKNNKILKSLMTIKNDDISNIINKDNYVNTTNKESNREIIKVDINFERNITDAIIYDRRKIKFTIFSGLIDDFMKEYELYLSKINSEQINIFDIKSDILYYIKGNFRKIVLIQDNNNLIGIAIFNIEQNSDSSNKIFLTHFSTIFYSNYSEICNNCITFIKETFPYINEIILYLYMSHI